MPWPQATATVYDQCLLGLAGAWPLESERSVVNSGLALAGVWRARAGARGGGGEAYRFGFWRTQKKPTPSRSPTPANCLAATKSRPTVSATEATNWQRGPHLGNGRDVDTTSSDELKATRDESEPSRTTHDRGRSLAEREHERTGAGRKRGAGDERAAVVGCKEPN